MSDWIKIEHVTPDKPEIVAMAQILGIDQDAVSGKMLRFWIWADQQLDSSRFCHALSVTEKFIDRVCCHSGFALAMRKVGWLYGEDGELLIPNFDRHNGQTAKARGLASKRKEAERAKKDVTEMSRAQRDKSVTRSRSSTATATAVLTEQQTAVPAALKKKIAKLELTVADLSDTSKLVNAKLLGQDPESNLNVVAAACHVLHQSAAKTLKNPVGLFAAIVSEARWGDITDQQMEEARGKIKQIRNGHGGTEWAKRLAGSISGGGAARPGEEH